TPRSGPPRRGPAAGVRPRRAGPRLDLGGGLSGQLVAPGGRVGGGGLWRWLWLVLLLAVLTAAGVLLVQRPDLLQSAVPDAPPVTSPPAVPTTGERSEGDN
ncbi:MAG: hypothetical protein ACK56X_11925, partial [Planctomyces sp.]